MGDGGWAGRARHASWRVAAGVVREPAGAAAARRLRWSVHVQAPCCGENRPRRDGPLLFMPTVAAHRVMSALAYVRTAGVLRRIGAPAESVTSRPSAAWSPPGAGRCTSAADGRLVDAARGQPGRGVGLPNGGRSAQAGRAAAMSALRGKRFEARQMRPSIQRAAGKSCLRSARWAWGGSGVAAGLVAHTASASPLRRTGGLGHSRRGWQARSRAGGEVGACAGGRIRGRRR